MLRSGPVLRPVALCLLLCGSSGLAWAQQDLEFAARYEASANGINASARRQLQRLEDGNYLLSNEIRAELAGLTIAELEQNSRFALIDGGIQPQAYRYELDGISSDYRAIDYHWETGTASSREDDEEWTVALTDGVSDALSHQFLLQQRIAEGVRDKLDFFVIDEDEIDLHSYRVVGTEILDTPLGRLDCILVERIRDPDDERRTRFWLARDWHFLLAKLEQRDGSGLNVELELESAVVAGEQVRPLP